MTGASTRRNWQVFAAPDDGEPLVEGPHPWIDDRWVYLPLEHWELLQERARRENPELAHRLALASGAVDPAADDAIELPPAELEVLVAFVETLADRVESEPDLTDEPTDEIPDAYPSDEHARMLRSVGVVLREALRTGRPARSWKE